VDAAPEERWRGEREEGMDLTEANPPLPRPSSSFHFQIEQTVLTCGSGVTLPTSTIPKPKSKRPSIAIACLSNPAAKPIGLESFLPKIYEEV